MRISRPRSLVRSVAGSTLAILLSASLAGCVTNEELGNPEGWEEILPAKNPQLAALVPPEIQAKGKITVGTNPPYAPNEFKDSDGNIIGFEMDLIRAAGAMMGLEVEVNQMDFNLILPALSAGSVDVGATAFTDTEERQKNYDFVDFYSAGISWATQPGNENTIDPDNACGLKVAVQKGTYSDTDEVQGRSEECEAQGKPPIEKLVYEKADAAATATILKKAQAYSSDSPVIDFAIARSEGKLVRVGEPFDTAPFGMGVKKNNPLGRALAATLQTMMNDGTYEAILKQWGLEDGGLDAVTFNLKPYQLPRTLQTKEGTK
ncbi:ABC transporter substrate-binding protein [Corynebacterium macclintockiae]|uniref:ABC transporter substrate-binding protein n=1 Tax=Corynebacterium macclintockiae TaxID=2913501 RepID=UPI00254D5449|nr:ABC transporter substrate-binding protein [Corynebacterium macclintockiae]MDK8889885.1 ABC transporter substrate-binding protein [Corynebacterium macclintockiae]